MYLRKVIQLTETQLDEMSLTADAITEMCDASAYPISFREPLALREVVSRKIAALRAARTADLRKKFETGHATA
jgi:hypothetical protein